MKQPFFLVYWLVLLAASAICGSAFAQKSLSVGSHSMEPTLLQGSQVTIDVVGALFYVPRRGDLVVFQPPHIDKPQLWISRIVGIPGDTVEYSDDKKLSINGRAVGRISVGEFRSVATPGNAGFPKEPQQMFEETLDGTRFRVVFDRGVPGLRVDNMAWINVQRACSVSKTVLRCSVPPDHYFVLSDNRDRANDGRYWGLLPTANIAAQVTKTSSN